AARARDHHADGIEQMAPRVVAHLIGKGGVTEFADEFDDGGSRAGGGMERRQRFGVGHWIPPGDAATARASSKPMRSARASPEHRRRRRLLPPAARSAG